MKIDVTEDGTLRLKEVFNSIVLETPEGDRFLVHMRDDCLEIGVVDDSKKHEGPEVYYNWFVAKDGDIKPIVPVARKEDEMG